MFKTLFSKLRENKLHGYNAPNSGMHIHVSKDALKPYDILKIMSFVNNPENFQFILDISQRNRERLEEWAAWNASYDVGLISSNAESSAFLAFVVIMITSPFSFLDTDILTFAASRNLSSFWKNILPEFFNKFYFIEWNFCNIRDIR